MKYEFAPDTTIPLHLKTSPGIAPQAVARAPIAPLRAPVARTARPAGKEPIRLAYRVLGFAAPALAARLALRQLTTPPRAAEEDWQLALRRQARTRRLAFGGGSLAVYEWGQGPTILLVHGWGAHGAHMGKLVEPLVEAGFRVVSFDAPAHGASSGSSTGLLRFAASIAAVAAASGPLHGVIGHSLGAGLSLYAWRDWGFDIRRLVLIGSFADGNWFIDAFGQRMGLAPGVVARLRTLLSRRHPGKLEGTRLSVAEMVRAVDFPTLIIHDRDDTVVPFEHSQALARASGFARFKGTQGLGHEGPLADPEVIRQVVQFAASPI